MNFARKNLLNLAGAFGLATINLIIGVLLSRLLQPEGLGQYFVIISSITLCVCFFGLGLGYSGVYFINNFKYPSPHIAATILQYSIAVSILLGTIFLLLLNKTTFFGDLSSVAVAFAVIQIFFLLITENMYPLLLADMRVKENIIVKLLPRIFLLVFLGVILFTCELTVSLAITATSIGMGIGVVFLLFFEKPDPASLKSFDNALFKQMSLYGVKLNLSNIILILNGQIGILLIKFMLPDDFSEVGYYGRAVRLGGMILIISGAIGPLLFSKWAKADNTNKKTQVIRVSRIFVLLCTFILIVGEYFADSIVTILYGVAFAPSIPMVQIILFGIAARFLVIPFIQMFSSTGKPFHTSIILGFNLCLMTVLMLILVPRYKGLGASVSFTLSNFIGLLLAYYLIWKEYKINPAKCLVVNKEDIYSAYKSIFKK